MEVHRTARPDSVDSLPFWRPSPLVSLCGLFKRTILRPVRRRPLRGGRSVRLPALLRISLRQPAGEPAKSIHQALAKGQNAARWQSRPATALSRKGLCCRKPRSARSTKDLPDSTTARRGSGAFCQTRLMRVTPGTALELAPIDTDTSSGPGTEPTGRRFQPPADHFFRTALTSNVGDAIGFWWIGAGWCCSIVVSPTTRSN